MSLSDNFDDNILLLKNNNEIYDYYNLKIYKDTNNKLKNGNNIKLEFNDLLCIYNKYHKLIYEISYYNIISQSYSNNLWGFKYLTYDKNNYEIYFYTYNSKDIINSIKKKLNKLS